MIDTVSVERAGEGSRVGSLIAERVSLSQPWYRAAATRDAVDRAITRLNAALAAIGSAHLVLSDSDLSRLPALERAATLLTLALAERTGLVIIDQADGFADETETRAFLTVVERLTPASTTVIVGLPETVTFSPTSHRPVQSITLSTQEVAF
jgi:RND superfamily putative drug exporter